MFYLLLLVSPSSSFFKLNNVIPLKLPLLFGVIILNGFKIIFSVMV